MIKIILDTNVLVSALIKPNTPPALILEKHVPQCEWCLSAVILEEYRMVLMRPKFRTFPDFYNRAITVLALVEQIGVFYLPEQHIDRISDEADNRFLELAVKAQADYLITGNLRDFDFSIYEQTQIVSPVQFINLFPDSP